MTVRALYTSLFILLIGTASANPALAYKKLGLAWKDGKPQGFTVCLKGAPPGALDRIKEAAQKWNYSKFKFTFEAEKCLDYASSGGADGTSYIEFTTITGPGTKPDDAGDATPRNPDAAPHLKECDIRFNINKKWYTKATGTPAEGENDLLSVAMHEFGHCLGLQHSEISGTVMRDHLLLSKTQRTLTQDDIDGRNDIYGKP
ncbi:matrixin family metalloprotease [Azospirillum sp.]|uniref:matrixin family metalloprotease n=1 Tax=Azospirillum sp. TaxID=34012 RepID=UPI002D5F082B|nr:matrixin family metalloprotease [Azospirillum sp.]HYD69913.1 matrixin family metalloprotease [Azospirillum sp.]